jgi:DNA-binding LytR/AlgR family response regulator
VVNAGCVAEATRFLSGRLALRLNNRPETLVVSRTYAQRFKQM